MVTAHRPVVAALLLAVATPALAFAQAPKAGVVTTLEGNVTATRAVAPQPTALKFKDDVFLQDKITTGEQSLARMLLGGKAVVTVRERSVLTITEVPGRSTIELDSGKFALAVARERMRPGEVIEIRTPNAIAGVRGSVIVTEVVGAATSPTVTSNLYVLTGSMDAQTRDLATRAPVGTPQPVGVLQNFRVIGTLSSVLPIRPEQLAGIRSGLSPRGKPHEGAANQDQLTAQSMQTAVALTGALTPGQLQSIITSAATPPLPTAAEPTNTIAPIIALDQEIQVALASGTAVPSAGTIGLVGGLLTNPGFEAGNFTGWTLSGAGAVVSQFGSLKPIEGNFMGLIHTGTNSTLSGCGSGAECTRSTLSQSFNVNSVVTITARGFLLSNEFPSFTSTNSSFNDRYLLQLIDSAGATFTLFDQRVNETPFSSFGTSASAGGFTLGSSGGVAPFDLGKKTVVTASGTATLRASVANVSDTILDSAFILDAVAVTQDPPLFFLTSGALSAPTTLFRAVNESHSFDSLLLVCCGATATLAGPALHATDSAMTLPFGVVSAIQGGSITSSWPGAMVQLDGGNYVLGPIVSVFDVAGAEPSGSDRPLRHGGTFLEANNASIATGNVMIVDTALLEASAPLLKLNHSVLVTNDSALEMTVRAKVSAVGPLFSLNASTLGIAQGALVSVRNGSALTVNGSLVHLANGSILNLANGPLAQVLGNSSLNVTGSLISFGAGNNTVNINNNLCATLSCASIGGLPIAFTGGANPANASVSGAVSGTGTVNMSPTAAAVVMSGATSTLKVGGP